MKAYLKFGGLALSAMLTLSLFVRLFGMTPYGVFVAISALALFEGGAIAWANVLGEAQHGQRSIARLGQWYCVISSVASSGAEIIMATNLWKPDFDLNFVTLLVIIGALAVNVLGMFAYYQLDPTKAQRNRELDRQAKARKEAEALEDQVVDQSFAKARSMVTEISGQVSGTLASEIKSDVVAYILAQTRGGANTIARSVPERGTRPSLNYSEDAPLPEVAERGKASGNGAVPKG